MDIMKKLEALQNTEEFEQAMAMVNSAEEMQELFKKHGVDLTVDELEQLLQTVAKQAEGEISAEDLDAVAGGIYIGPTWQYKFIGKLVIKILTRLKR